MKNYERKFLLLAAVGLILLIGYGIFQIKEHSQMLKATDTENILEPK